MPGCPPPDAVTGVVRVAKKRPQREPEEAEAVPLGAERNIDTILMWVSEPSMPIKMCVRGAGGERGRVFTGGAASVGGLFRFSHDR